METTEKKKFTLTPEKRVEICKTLEDLAPIMKLCGVAKPITGEEIIAFAESHYETPEEQSACVFGYLKGQGKLLGSKMTTRPVYVTQERKGFFDRLMDMVF